MVGFLVAGAGALSSFGNLASEGMSIIKEHPLLAYFLVLAVLVVDGGMSFNYGWQGAFGLLFTQLFGWFNAPFIVYSWQVLILFALFPIISIVFDKSFNH